MSGNLEYIKTLKNQTQRKKSVTITIEEKVLDKITAIADELQISKNQIISDISGNFVEDYAKAENPKFYIINSNNTYMPEGHLHMVRGNRASAWRDTKSAIEGLIPGDYVFIYMNKYGVIASGVVKSKFMINDYCLVKVSNNEKTGECEYETWDEYFVSVEFDKDCIKLDDVTKGYIIDENRIIKASEISDKVSKQPLNRTKVYLSKEEGEKLRELFLKK